MLIMNKVVEFFSCNKHILFVTSKRFAGHNKWSNIKHIKAANDGKKSVLYDRLCRQMRRAIIDGESTDPLKNTKLSQVIEVAKRECMPLATINNVLKEQKESSANLQTGTVEFHGPGSCIIVVEIKSDRLIRSKNVLKATLRKLNLQTADTKVKHLFQRKGIIITEVVGTVDIAMEHAIQSGAEEVEEIEVDNHKYFQFSCDHLHLPKVTNLLEGFNYEIVSADEEYIPHIFVELNKEQQEKLNTIYDRIRTSEGVTKMYDNVA